MSEYDINKIDNTTQQIDAGGSYQEPENKPNYTMAFLAGFGASVLVGIALAVIGICMKVFGIVLTCLIKSISIKARLFKVIVLFYVQNHICRHL